ncbi:hypothetical protein GEMRC1_004093 [Eukaryota sp. GEM-RC1]
MIPSEFEHQINGVCYKLRRRQITGAFHSATTTISLLKTFLESYKKNYCDWKDLRSDIIDIGHRLSDAQPLELAVPNILRRVLFIIRSYSQQSYVLRPLSILSSSKDDQTLPSPKQVHTPIIDKDLAGFCSSLDELETEVTESYIYIQKQAQQHIHSNETILVIGHSTTVFEFLSSSQNFICKVYVLERAPDYSGHRMANRLTAKGISVTVVKDSAVAAIMPRINKVIIGTHSVLADGGLLTPSGTGLVARIAASFSIPVVCVCASYKISFQYVKDQFVKNVLLSPSVMVSELGLASSSNVDIVNPLYEYIPPRFVTLYITNIGQHNPSEIYRLAGQFFHPEDPNFS